MDLRPPKRRKHLVVLSSEEESDSLLHHEPPKIAPKGREASNASKVANANRESKQTLPARSRKKAVEPKKSTAVETTTLRGASQKSPGKKVAPKPISTFFKVEPREQRFAGVREQRAQDVKEDAALEEEEEDVIEDDSSVEDVVARHASQNTTRAILDRRKTGAAPLSSDAVSATTRAPPRPSQKFKVPAKGASIQKVVADGGDGRPWAERFAPRSLEELAVHKKKISDVQSWLANVLSGRERKSLLILKGPSGAGKTATVAALARAMDFDLVEWRNPVGSDFSSEGYQSMSAQFEDFLGRSGRFDKLDLGGGAAKPDTTSSFSASKISSESARRKVILLEEFPNTFLSTSVALRSFRSCILEYLATYTPSMGSFYSNKGVPNAQIKPMIIIITETRLATATAASDSFTAHRLLGSEILSHPSASVIEFNPVASTFVVKALDLVLQKEARQSGRRRIPGPSVLKALGVVGDVRSAIGSLEFLCVRGEDGDDWGGRVAGMAKKGGHASVPLTKMEQESLQLVTQRESSLSLFHAVGKVVYNKRDAVTGTLAQDLTPPPNYLSEHARPKISQVSVDQLMDETGTDTRTFIAALHENYLMSCEGQSFMPSLNGCLDTLSDSDLLDSHQGGTFQGAASDTLRQDEISFHLAVRGILFALPDPVKRASYPTNVPGRRGGRSDAHKMFYPTSVRLSRQMEDVSNAVDGWMHRLRIDSTRLSPSFTKNNNHRQFHFQDPTPNAKPTELVNNLPSSQPLSTTSDPPLRTTLACTKTELLLEHLPYMTKISRQSASSINLDELESITQFHGIEAHSSEVSEEEEGNPSDVPLVAEWATDRSSEEKVADAGKKVALSVTGAGMGMGGDARARVMDGHLGEEVEVEEEKLWLSEDDIED